MTSYKAIFAAPPSIGSIIFSFGLVTALPTPASNANFSSGPQIDVRLSGQDNTYSALKLSDTFEFEQENSDIYNAITEFYGTLSATQIPLEKDFSEILFQNIWDLYAT